MLFRELTCSVCVREIVDRNDVGENLLAAVSTTRTDVVITHESAGLMTCSRGHKTVVVFQGRAHGLLYERALQRLADGALRDAVLDAYTALEMYLQSVVERARFEAHPGSDLNVVRNEVRKAIKTSDRALGAALAAIAIRSSKTPPNLDRSFKQVGLQELRNKATHAGAYPTLEQAEWLVVEVATIVTEFEERFLESPTGVTPSYADAAFALVWKRQRDEHPEVLIATVHAPLVLDESGASPKTNATKRLAEYRAGEQMLRWW